MKNQKKKSRKCAKKSWKSQKIIKPEKKTENQKKR